MTVVYTNLGEDGKVETIGVGIVETQVKVKVGDLGHILIRQAP